MLQISFITATGWILALLVGCMVITRVFTEIRHAANMRRSHTTTTIPYTIPWLGHTIPFFTKPQQWLFDFSRQVNSGIFVLVPGGRKCHIIMSPSLAKEVLAVKAPVDNHDMVGSFMRNVWDDKGAFGAMDQDMLWGKIHRAVYQLNREPFLSQDGDIVTEHIEKEVLSLVSDIKPTTWQARADVVIHESNDYYEASFFPLIRHFVADMVLPALYGKGFTSNYPDLAADLFAFDSKFHFFLMGLPSWVPVSGLRESAAARDRVKGAMADFHNALVAASRGKATNGSEWGDMDDVCSVMRSRVHLWEEAVDELSSNKEACIASHSFLLWVTLINSNVIVFWLLFHIYQDFSLLSAIREQVSPFVHVQKFDSGGSNEQPTITLNSRGVQAQTPLLKSAFYETMRLYTQSNSFKNVQADFTVTESKIDHSSVASGEKEFSLPQSKMVYQLRRGDMICVPFGLHQSDFRYWRKPDEFDGGRFIIQQQQQNSTLDASVSDSKVSVDSTRISPWGMGASVCKGQKFSYREVLDVAAAILICWDMEPAGTDGWSHPGLTRAGGTAVPKEDFRIRLRRRVP